MLSASMLWRMRSVRCCNASWKCSQHKLALLGASSNRIVTTTQVYEYCLSLLTHTIMTCPHYAKRRDSESVAILRSVASDPDLSRAGPCDVPQYIMRGGVYRYV
jgi:hypothetical protein